LLAHLQLENLLPAELAPENIALFANNPKKEAHLFIDRLRRSLLFKPRHMVCFCRSIVDLNRHFGSQVTQYMVDGVLGERRGPMLKP